MLPSTGDLLARKYRLGGELGRGAMGIVYEARHETLDQRVAIKILRRSELHDEAGAVRRFEREARIVAKLDSRHVVKVVDVDRTDDDVPYLVMELLEGRDLGAEVEARDAPIAIAEAVGWMTQVCEAMRVAHEAGVVHRDLKLSNVFLTRDGTLKVLDFGVAVLGHGNAEGTATTNVAGTPRYMAPEQLLGEPPVPASDVWAIGVMLYRLLSGRFPYDSPTMAGQMLAMMKGCPALDAVAPRVPRELAAVVTRALGHALEERWASARELAEALAPFGEESVALPPAPPPADVSRPVTVPAPARRRSPPAAVSVALVVVVASALVWLAVRAQPGASSSAPPVTAATDSAAVGAPPASLAPSASVSVAVSLAPTPSAASSTGRGAVPGPAARPRSSLALPTPSVVAPGPQAPTATTASTDDGFPPHL